MSDEEKLDAAIRRLLSPIPVTPSRAEWVTDKAVLLVLGLGIITILLSIIVGLLLTPRALPNWAENVFVSIATASALKLGDCVNALVALSSGRTVERLGGQLAGSAPAEPQPTPPKSAAEGAEQAAGAAREVADELADKAQ